MARTPAEQTFGGYTITTIADDEYRYGRIRIEPPVVLSEGYLKQMGQNRRANFAAAITSREATLVSFDTEQNDTEEWYQRAARVSNAVHDLIADLALAFDHEVFKEKQLS